MCAFELIFQRLDLLGQALLRLILLLEQRAELADDAAHCPGHKIHADARMEDYW